MVDNPKIEELISKVDSKFTLVIMAARRARQINEYLAGMRRPGVLKYRPPSVEYLNKKPLSIAMQEIAEGKVAYTRDVNNIK